MPGDDVALPLRRLLTADMTPPRFLIALVVVTGFLLVGDYCQYLKDTHPFDLSRVRTISKINGVPSDQMPGALTGANGIFRQRLAPLTSTPQANILQAERAQLATR